MSESINYKQILITAVITLIITIVAGVILYNYQAKDPHLSYVFQSGIPFKGDSGELVVYNYIILNDGEETIEEINSVIKFSNSIITEVNLESGLSISHKDNVENNNTHNILIENLNPKESLKLSFLVMHNDGVKNPQISLRGKGVNGVPYVLGNGVDKLSLLGFGIPTTFIASIMTIFIFMFTSLAVTIKSRASTSNDLTDDDDKTNGDQREILSYLASLNNLMDESERYNNINKRVSYWSESDRISFSVTKKNKEDARKKKQLLLDLLNYTKIHQKSVGIIYYNIARISKVIGDKKDSENYLSKAKEIIPKLINKRLQLDRVWK